MKKLKVVGSRVPPRGANWVSAIFIEFNLFLFRFASAHVAQARVLSSDKYLLRR